jgi:hypothetical protein
MGDDWNRIFLEVIRWKPVVFRADGDLKETPGPPRYESCEAQILRAYELAFGWSWAADQISDDWRNAPDYS